MNQLLKFGGLLTFCAWFGSAVAADARQGTETRPVDARVVRVKVEGLVDLKVTQGPVAGLVISGDKDLLVKTTTGQDGDTIIIDTEVNGIQLNRKNHGLRAELTLPALREVSSESVGWTDISGFSGQQLDLKLDGAGSMKVKCDYKVISVVLGGVGSMNIQGGAATEGIDLNLRGAGYVTLRGGSKWLKADLGGLGGLDAQHFQVDTVNLDLSGLGNATVNARQNATLNVSGLGSVTVHGKPANRSVRVDGLGKVSWK